MEDSNTDGYKIIRELFGLFLIFLGLLVLLSLISFSVDDPSLNHVLSDDTMINNMAGLFGAYISGFLNDIFGVASYVLPILLCALGAGYISTTFELFWWKWCGYFLITLTFMCTGSAWNLSLGDISGGGMVGSSLYDNLSYYLNPMGTILLGIFVLLVATQLAFTISWTTLYKQTITHLIESFNKLKIADKFRKKGEIVKSIENNQVIIDNYANYAEKKLNKYDFSKFKTPILKFFKCFSLGKREKIQAIPSVNLDMEIHSFPDDESITVHKNTNNNDAIYGRVETNAELPNNSYGADLREQEEQTFSNNASLNGTELSNNSSYTPTINNKEQCIENNFKPINEDKHIANKEISKHQVEILEEYDLKNDSKLHTNNNQTMIPKLIKKKFTAFPSLNLLKIPVVQQKIKSSRDEMESKGQILVNRLNEFGVQGELVRITPGPVVTMFEFRPAAGVRVNKISNLSDDLALALKAIAIRIQAPIPGSDTVGIELPNTQREIVSLREMFEVDDFINDKSPLLMALGKDIAGYPVMANLASMPHLLVAGTTGAGKSVCLNSILLSFLYKIHPEDLRLLLIDPKRVEFAVYADLPHLIHPVVTDMVQAKNALEWATKEMDQRYEFMKRLGVRDVSSYNKKFKSFDGNLPSNLSDLEKLPYIVIIIDELADLMLTAGREVESSIMRLGQLARAAGIHIILATQRPSVDVVTGLIKANLPWRISFQVSSRHDSRTILDQSGAEHLLGKGDMLFKPSGGKLKRLHAPFVSDDEVTAVVEHWKKQLPTSYGVDFSEWGNEGTISGLGSSGDASDDALYSEVLEFVRENGKASISLIQRRFKIGFNRAARIVEQLEKDGIISPADGSKPRTIVK